MATSRGPAHPGALYHSAATKLGPQSKDNLKVSWTASAGPSRCCAARRGTAWPAVTRYPRWACCHVELPMGLCAHSPAAFNISVGLTTRGSSFCLSQESLEGWQGTGLSKVLASTSTHTKQVSDYCPLLGPTSMWLTCPVSLSMELGVKSVGQGDAAGLWSTANSGLLNQTTERSGLGPRPRTQTPRLCTQKPVEGTAQISLIVLSEGQYSEGPGDDT